MINGAPGATGPVLNHFNKPAVQKYLNNMSDKIQNRLGPLSGNIRSLFTDSMELEGSNWSYDMAEEFKKRRGYDVQPYLPFILFKMGSMGNVLTYEPKVSLHPNWTIRSSVCVMILNTRKPNCCASVLHRLTWTGVRG